MKKLLLFCLLLVAQQVFCQSTKISFDDIENQYDIILQRTSDESY